jgi:hypothetical protein
MSTYGISLFNPSNVYLILNNVNGMTYASHSHIIRTGICPPSIDRLLWRTNESSTFSTDGRGGGVCGVGDGGNDESVYGGGGNNGGRGKQEGRGRRLI